MRQNLGVSSGSRTWAICRAMNGGPQQRIRKLPSTIRVQLGGAEVKPAESLRGFVVREATPFPRLPWRSRPRTWL